MRRAAALVCLAGVLLIAAAGSAAAKPLSSQAAPQAPRPRVIEAQRLAQAGRHRDALAVWDDLLAVQPIAFPLVAQDYAASAAACGDEAAAAARLRALDERQPGADLLAALLRLAPDAPARLALLRTHLQAHSTLSGAAALLKEATAQDAPLSTQDLERLQGAAATAARPLQRYRCAACGFEAQHFFWQCPGCQNWDSYPPRRLEDT